MELLGSSELTTRFGWSDWCVVAAYLVVTTILGAKLSGKQATIRDFFLGGRKLPWWAVCGSIIATEVSTATFVAVPAISFAVGGDLTYLQLAIGSILARFIVAIYFIPRYYEKEIYSPYDYVGLRVGSRVKTATTGLFMVGAVLGQGARLFTSAFVLSVVADVELVTAIWMMGLFSALWAMIGGITMVIWTDVIQFFVLMSGALVALWFAIDSVPASWGDSIQIAADAGKFRFFDFTGDLSVRYTFWCGLLATPFINLAAFGTDQVMAQRMFCCKNQDDAAKATIVSSVSILITVVMLLVGVSLFIYFRFNPFTEQESALYAKDKTYLLPIFIVRALPPIVKGLIVAAIFAAAVSTLQSALAALAQTTSGPLLKRFAKVDGRSRSAAPAASRRRNAAGRNRKSRTQDEESGGASFWRSDVSISKALVAVWGIVLCAMATGCIVLARRYENSIDLVLALAGYSYGPLLGIFLLAFLPKPPSDTGLIWAVPLAVLAVFAASVHEPWAPYVVWPAVLAVLGLALIRLRGDVPKVFFLAFVVVLIALLPVLRLGTTDAGDPKYLAYPWTFPIGATITFFLGYVLGRPVATGSERDRSG